MATLGLQYQNIPRWKAERFHCWIFTPYSRWAKCGLFPTCASGYQPLLKCVRCKCLQMQPNDTEICYDNKSFWYCSRCALRCLSYLHSTIRATHPIYTIINFFCIFFARHNDTNKIFSSFFWYMFFSCLFISPKMFWNAKTKIFSILIELTLLFIFIQFFFARFQGKKQTC